MSGCSCRVGSRSGSGGWLLALLALGLFVRRRGRRWLPLLLVAALGACSSPARVSEPLSETAPERAAPTTTREALETPAFAHLGPARPVATDLAAPVLSPNGQRIAMSDRRLTQLHVADLRTGELTQLAEGERVGYLPTWSADGGTLRYRHAEQSGTAVPHYAVALDGGEPAVSVPATRHVWLDDERRVVLREAGGQPRIISPEGDRYLTPAISADQRHVVFWGMSDGLFLHRLEDGGLVRIGRGGHPSFGPEGRWLVFERSLDDGHVVVASELWITDLHDPRYRTGPLTDTADIAERTPSLAAGRVAWATAEGVLVAELSVD